MAFVYNDGTVPEGAKTIDTLVSDIYEYIGGQGTFDSITDEDITELSSDLANMFKARLTERRESKGQREFYLRMSNYGKPLRYLWYEANFEGRKEKNEPHLYLKFMLGDIFETVMLFLAKKSGHVVTRSQEKVSFNGLEGSMDAVIDGVLVDVKSASKWAYEKKFLGRNIFNGDDSFAYIPQIKGYGEGAKIDKQAFFVGNKETGEIALVKVPPNIKVPVKEMIDNARAAISDKENKPPRCFEDEPASYGNRKLAKGCQFCPFKYDCWKDANDGEGLRVFEYANNRLEFLTEINRLPTVPERPSFNSMYYADDDED